MLSQGVGYGIVIGVGFFFTFVMMGLTWIQNRYSRFDTKTSEEFNTASRSVKPGLIAAGIVSAWTWAATLLQSATVGYRYGVAGPFWYAAGATVQILMFAILACKTKMNAPRCHTYLEIIYVRYGKTAHIVFLFFALVTNVLVGSQLLLGGSAVVTALTGMNVYAAVFLIPTGVCAYVILGGLRATFLCDYSHGLVLMVIIMYFMFTVYTSNETIGSPSRMYDLLHEAAIKRPVAGNHEGSYLTLKSNLALIFGVIQLCSGSGTVFLDQAYFQRAVASRPTTAVKAYIMGGLAWFAIPFGFATTLGLAAVALADHPQFPTYPNLPSESDISAGLASALSASALLGTHGAVALLLSLFLAVTSCASAELIAVSSILTFDIYKAYFNPSASPERLITVSKYGICGFGLTMSIFAVVWNLIGIDLGWLFLVMGLIIGGAVFPMAFSITWTGQSTAGAIAGPISGLCAGIIAWLVTAQQYFGELTIASTGDEYSTLAGNMAAIFTGLIVTTVVSLYKPQNFDWAITRAINSPTVTDLATVTPPEESQETSLEVKRDGDGSPAAAGEVNSNEKQVGDIDTRAATPAAVMSQKQQQDLEEAAADADLEEHPTKLRRALTVAYIAAISLTLIMDFLIPIPMFLSHYVFSRGFFTAWIVISFIWVFASTFISCVLPILETGGFLKGFAVKVWRDLRGKKIGK